MERLPFIDELWTSVAAGPERTWSALVSAVAGISRSPMARYAKLVGGRPAETRGDWRGGEPAPGATVPGFAVDEASAPRRMVLSGRHRFARYELVFELEPIDGGTQTRLSAQTWAEFPGATGALYRALVIGSGGHRVAVRRMLRGVSAHAARPVSSSL